MFHNFLVRYYMFFALFVLYAFHLAGAEELSRDEAILIALENNPKVIAAKNEWEAAQAQIIQTRGLPDPEFELEYEEVPGSMSIGKFGERNLGLSQRIEYPMKRWYKKRAAVTRADAMKFSALEMKKLETVTNVKLVYDRILLGKKILEYTESNLRLAQSFLEKASIRFEAGDISKLEVLRAEVEVGRAHNQVTVARNELLLPKAELNMLLARDIQTPLDVLDDLMFNPPDLELGKLKRTAMENRPDIRGAEMSINELQINRSAAKSSLIPDLNLGVFRQTIAEPNGNEGYWRIRFGVDIPIWSLFRQRGVMAEANAEIGRVTAEKNALYYQALLEVERAFLTVKASEDQVRLFREKTLSVAEQAYEMANLSYEEGKASYLELLETQRLLTETRLEFAETIFRFRSGLTALEKSVGGEMKDL